MERNIIIWYCWLSNMLWSSQRDFCNWVYKMLTIGSSGVMTGSSSIDIFNLFNTIGTVQFAFLLQNCILDYLDLTQITILKVIGSSGLKKRGIPWRTVNSLTLWPIRITHENQLVDLGSVFFNCIYKFSPLMDNPTKMIHTLFSANPQPKWLFRTDSLGTLFRIEAIIFKASPWRNFDKLQVLIILLLYP